MLATRLYMDDHDSWRPNHSDVENCAWSKVLFDGKYCTSRPAMSCPSDVSYTGGVGSWGRVYGSYAESAGYLRMKEPRFQRVSPSKLLIYADALRNWETIPKMTMWRMNNNPSSAWGGVGMAHGLRSSGMAMFDGHVRQAMLNEMRGTGPAYNDTNIVLRYLTTISGVDRYQPVNLVVYPAYTLIVN